MVLVPVPVAMAVLAVMALVLINDGDILGERAHQQGAEATAVTSRPVRYRPDGSAGSRAPSLSCAGLPARGFPAP
jgi:archaellin